MLLAFSRNTWLISLLLITAVCLSIWSILLSHQINNNHPHHGEADIFMTDIIATILGQDGAPTLRVVSPDLMHYNDDNATRLALPHVTIYRRSPTPWQVTSQTALATDGLQQIVFSDNVQIMHPADSQTAATTVTTHSLTVFPDTEQAHTNDPVTITQPDTKVYGVGMQADLRNGNIHLLSDTRSVYVPTA